MNDAELSLKIKELMIRELDLSDLTPAQIDDGSALFGEGLGLDSLDALQLAIALEEEFGVTIPEGEEAKPIFASVNAIALHITQQRS
ncbi:MAG: phosphopantetheine-binding protein [Polyangiaceae bacterium]